MTILLHSFASICSKTIEPNRLNTISEDEAPEEIAFSVNSEANAKMALE